MRGVENENLNRSYLSGTINPSKTPKSNYLGQQWYSKGLRLVIIKITNKCE
jgi:hypothetical protein